MTAIGTDVHGNTTVYDDETVDADGDINLTSEDPHAHNYVKKVRIGLKYRHILKPMRMDIMTQGGTSKGSIGSFAEVVVSFFKSLGVKSGRDTDNLNTITETQVKSNNLARNPDFELGDQDWSKHSGWTIIEDSNAYSGDWVAKYEWTAGEDYRQISQDINVKPTEIYTVSGYFKSGTATERELYVWVNFYDSDLTLVEGNYGTVTIGTNYENISQTVTVPATATLMRIMFGMDDVESGAICYCDKVSAYKSGTASEPFTGDVVVSHDGGYGVEDHFVISGDDPLPCNVRAIVPRIEKTGR